MEEEARRAMEIAEEKLSKNDYDGAKNFIKKAELLYPNLDGLKQVSMMIDVYIYASNRRGGGEDNWYKILGVDPLADEEAVKNSYKQLALLLHPDKNKLDDAEGAFKLVLEAWCLLSDNDKRASYDQRRKSKEAKTTKMQKSTNQRQRQTSDVWTSSMFWIACRRCKTQWQDSNMNKPTPCPNCSPTFITNEATPKESDKRTNNATLQEQQWSGV